MHAVMVFVDLHERVPHRFAGLAQYTVAKQHQQVDCLTTSAD